MIQDANIETQYYVVLFFFTFLLNCIPFVMLYYLVNFMNLLWQVHVPIWLIETNIGCFSFKVSSGMCSFFLLDIPSNQLHCIGNLS